MGTKKNPEVLEGPGKHNGVNHCRLVESVRDPQADTTGALASARAARRAATADPKGAPEVGSDRGQYSSTRKNNPRGNITP